MCPLFSDVSVTKIDTGRAGEDKAAVFLERGGYKILERNFRNKFGEIDIVALDGGVICFVEVRSRRGPFKHEAALASINRKKQYRLSKLAVSYLKDRSRWGRRARFDVVSVSLACPGDDIVLIKDAFNVVDKYA